MPVICTFSEAEEGDLIKILWHDGIGMSLYAKRLEHGRFILAVAGRWDRRDQRGAARLTCSTGSTRRDRVRRTSWCSRKWPAKDPSGLTGPYG